MESWFLADRKALGEFYGPGYQENALSPNQPVEQVAKQDVLDGLVQATRSTKKGRYDKGAHSYEILAKLDPEKVKNASPYANRFIKELFRYCQVQRVTDRLRPMKSNTPSRRTAQRRPR